MSLAYHNLVRDKPRSLLSLMGVGLAIVLILILKGFLVGIDRVASTCLNHIRRSSGIFQCRPQEKGEIQVAMPNKRRTSWIHTSF